MIDPDSLPDAVLEVDSERRVVAANAAASALVGLPLAALRGRTLVELVEPRTDDGEPVLADGWHRSARLRSVRGIPEQALRLRVPGGGDLVATVTGRYRRNGDGRVTGAVLVLRRDGGRRAASPAKTLEVISTVSHELRSPLTAVKGFTSLLLNRWDRLDDDQKRTMLEQVHDDADRVTRLINELLDFSRLESGRLVLRRRLVDITALAEAVVAKVRMGHPELDATVSFEAGFPEVFVDADKVEQVLTNLVENAAKYGSAVGIRVSGRVASDEAELSVSDRGSGIAPDDLRRVFSKFFRAAHTRPSGLGLGLYLCRGLVEAHGGRLEGRSQVGVGSTFTFTLPLGVPEELAP